MDSEEFKGAIRVQPIRVVRVLWDDDDALDDEERKERGDPRAVLRAVSVEMQRMKNRFYFAWRAWHEENGSGPKVLAWFDEYLTWARAKKDERAAKPPQCPVQAIPAACGQFIYAELARACPTTHSRCRTLMTNRESGDLAKRKAENSGFARWQRIVADLDGAPKFCRPQPIPFSLENTVLCSKAVEIRSGGQSRKGVQWYLRVRLDRDDHGTSRPIRLVLQTGGRHLIKVVRVLEACARYQEMRKRQTAARAKYFAAHPAKTPEEKAARLERVRELERDIRMEYLGETLWKFCGSNVVETEHGWSVQVCYREEKDIPAEVDPERTAVLWPGRRHPWRLRIPGCRTFWLGGRGRLVSWTRRTCGDQRATRAESYRHGSKSRRGHGLGRAMAGYKLANREEAMKKTLNGQLVASVLRILVERGAGRLVFRKPKERVEATRFLVTAGAPASRPGSWPWHQVQTMFAQKTVPLGIVFEAEPKSSRVEKSRKAKGPKK